MRPPRSLLALLTLLGATALTSAASACVTVGVYQDSPATALAPLNHAVGPGISAISTYLTAGNALAPALISTANHEHAMLMVTWDPDGGHDGAGQPRYRVREVAAGHDDRSLRALVAQLRTVRAGAVLRPMPEMNTPWYAWSGTVNGNTAAQYVAAWRRVRKTVRSSPGGRRIRLLWAPYATSIPDTAANDLAAYFPGKSQVDLVGASGYNFGTAGGLQWTAPGALFASAYATIEALDPAPFWIAETGSTAVGGDQPGWISSLATLPSTGLPKLAGIVWYDASDPLGDFRLRGTPVTHAFEALLQEACQ